MKFGRFQLQSRTFFGLVEGDQVAELDGSPFDTYKANGKHHALSTLKTLIPCEPRNFYCAGLNYAAHIEWGAKRKGIAPLTQDAIAARFQGRGPWKKRLPQIIDTLIAVGRVRVVDGGKSYVIQ